jgi:signal peptidase I
MKWFTWTISALLLVAIGLLAFLYISPDYNMYFVRSGSMTPNIKIGDLVISGPVGGPLTHDIQVGTVITYELKPGERVTHRVIAIGDDQVMTTQGDNSESPDPKPVQMSQVRGIYLMKIPSFGYLTSFIRTKIGWYVAIIVPAIVLVGWIVKDIVREALKSED